MPIENGMQRIYKSPGENFGSIISELIPLPPPLESAAEIIKRLEAQENNTIIPFPQERVAKTQTSLPNEAVVYAAGDE